MTTDPVRVILRSMTQDEFVLYIENAAVAYAADKVKADAWAKDGAVERARIEFANSLPEGLATKEHYLFSIYDEALNIVVGIIWFSIGKWQPQPLAFVNDFEVFEAYRRKGYGTQAFLALEDKVKEIGLHKIMLHVFGHNKEAQRLYERLGYQVTDIDMAKNI